MSLLDCLKWILPEKPDPNDHGWRSYDALYLKNDIEESIRSVLEKITKAEERDKKKKS